MNCVLGPPSPSAPTFLKAACASFDREDFIPAMNQLHAFGNKTRAQIAPKHPNEAQALLECIQRIIDAIDCQAKLELQLRE